MRYLVLTFEGAPMAVDISADTIRKIILDHPADDVDLWSVWQCPPAGSLAPSADITEQFAKTWAIEFSEPAKHVDPIPAFILLHARDELIRLKHKRMAELDPMFMPAVLTSARVAA